ncbi:hypothetical protein J2S41_004849 [Catenuloplanes atrovinosus]|uniref:Uncharacterized protein n=1 Tax=Catenuloplanes atrovinosus TaxID=137266 RepID=A0AAE3YSZ7_9ACTN|nr:hypothetical protein [Catenuloplanes atrovinosus]
MISRVAFGVRAEPIGPEATVWQPDPGRQLHQLREPTRPSGPREYELAADSDTLIRVERPFPIEFPLSEIVGRPRPRR